MSWYWNILYERPLKMVWQVEKGSRISYLVGTAHFFPYSSTLSLHQLLRKVETILTEGPLDEGSMQRIAEHGRQGDGSVDLQGLLAPEALSCINRVLEKRLAHPDSSDLYLHFHTSQPSYYELFTRDMRPWMALFSIWTTYLNWKFSVDLQAYQVAQKMGKIILPIETIAEQLEVLDGIPLERVQRHLNDAPNWKTYRDNYVRLYLEGSLEQLIAMTDRFPTRTPIAIGKRDQIMFERIKPVFERGPAAAFVGFPHVPGIRQLFLEEGYSISQGFK